MGGAKEITIDLDALQTSLADATSAKGIPEPGTSSSSSIQDTSHTALFS